MQRIRTKLDQSFPTMSRVATGTEVRVAVYGGHTQDLLIAISIPKDNCFLKVGEVFVHFSHCVCI